MLMSYVIPKRRSFPFVYETIKLNGQFFQVNFENFNAHEEEKKLLIEAIDFEVMF